MTVISISDELFFTPEESERILELLVKRENLAKNKWKAGRTTEKIREKLFHFTK